MPAAKTATSAYAIVGSDDGGVMAAAKELADKLSPGGDFGTEIIDGGAANSQEAAERIESAIEALLTFPFFGGGKLVWLKSATFLADDPMGRSEPVLAALEKLTATIESGLPDGTVFLLSATPVDKRRSFYKSLQRLAKVQVIDALDTSKSGWEEQAASLVREAAATHKLTLAGDSAELLALMTGGDRRQIDSEIEKLDLYLDGERREVTEEDVRLLVPVSHVGAVFELGNALSSRETARALELLGLLMFHGESAVGILFASIIPTVRNLLLARDLITRHRMPRQTNPFGFAKQLERLPASATDHLPRKKDGTLNTFSLGHAAIHAHRFTDTELRVALQACLDANVQLVTSSLEPEVVLTQLIVRIGTPAER